MKVKRGKSHYDSYPTFFYEFVLFNQFGINVIDYSEAADFFLAALKRPEVYLSALIIVGSLFLYRIIANYARKSENMFTFVILSLISFIGLFRREILIPIGLFYFFFFYVSLAKIEARRIVFYTDNVAAVFTRFGSPKEFKIFFF